MYFYFQDSIPKLTNAHKNLILNIDKLNQIWIVITPFPINLAHQNGIQFVAEVKQEKFNYNPNLVLSNKIKPFVIIYLFLR